MDRICKKCGEVKGVSFFAKDLRLNGGYSNVCRKCRAEWQRNRRLLFPERYRSYDVKRNTTKHRKEWFKNREKKLERIEWKRSYKKSPKYKEHSREYSKAYNASKKGKEVKKKYTSTEKGREYLRRKRRARYQKDIKNPQFRLKMSIKAQFNFHIKKNGVSTCEIMEKYLGYSPMDLYKHLESQFVGDMKWENYGTYWEIDHIKPRCMFDFNSYEDEQFVECWKLDNLKPLRIKENRSKGAKYG